MTNNADKLEPTTLAQQIARAIEDWKDIIENPVPLSEWIALAITAHSGEGRSNGVGEDATITAPREPTDDMVQAGLYQLSVGGDEWAMVYQIWVDMFDTLALDGGCTASLPTALATHQGEGERLEDHFPSGLRSGYARTAGGVPVQGGGVEIDCRCGWSTRGTDEQDACQQWADHARVALATHQGEGERLRAALFFLASAEAEYRRLHDLHGDSDIRTGRAWDRMRRRGDEARAALAQPEAGDGQ